MSFKILDFKPPLRAFLNVKKCLVFALKYQREKSCFVVREHPVDRGRKVFVGALKAFILRKSGSVKRIKKLRESIGRSRYDRVSCFWLLT